MKLIVQKVKPGRSFQLKSNLNKSSSADCRSVSVNENTAFDSYQKSFCNKFYENVKKCSNDKGKSVNVGCND